MMQFKVNTNPSLVTGEAITELTEEARKKANDEYTATMQEKMAALNAARDWHANCDLTRNNMWVNAWDN
jgi:hypothetical protein